MIDSDGGNKVDQIDLKLALKSLPNKVDVKMSIDVSNIRSRVPKNR